MKRLIVIAHNLRSAHNVGSLLRTAEGLGITEVIFSGYTPFPELPNDPRLPHEVVKLNKLIHKTALGAEHSQVWRRVDDIKQLFSELQNAGYTIAAVEQTANSIALPEYRSPEKLAVVLGREVEGVETEVLEACDVALEIPMFGQKESFNVVQAAAMVLYHCRFIA